MRLGARSVLSRLSGFFSRYGKYVLFAYCSLLLIVGSIPISIPSEISFFDKILHFLVFIIYGFLYSSSYGDIVLGLGFPLYLEAFHLFVPWRTFDILDLGTNLFSSLLGMLISRFFFKKEPSFP